MKASDLLLPHKEANGKTVKRGLARRTNRQGMETINAITQAAREIMEKEGIAHLTFQRVAKISGLTRSSVMYHFPSKEALMAHMIETYRDKLDKRLRVGCLEAEISGNPIADPTVAGFLEWYETFRHENQVNTSFGLSALTLSTSNENLRSILRDWYTDVFNQLRTSPLGTEALVTVLALEGLFYLKHFDLDVLEDEDVKAVLTLLRKRCSKKQPASEKMQEPSQSE